MQAPSEGDINDSIDQNESDDEDKILQSDTIHVEENKYPIY